MANATKRPAKPKAVAKQNRNQPGTLKFVLSDAIATAVFVFVSTVFGQVQLAAYMFNLVQSAEAF